MKLSYYPGCTLKTKARHFETSALRCLQVLGIDYQELERWNCCGAVYSLADDDLIHMLAPVRDLIRVKERGHDKVLTLCSMCYNTLARANDPFGRSAYPPMMIVNSLLWGAVLYPIANVIRSRTESPTRRPTRRRV